MKPFLFVLSVLAAYCVGMFASRVTRASEVPAHVAVAPVATHAPERVSTTPTATQTRAHTRTHGTARQRTHSARTSRRVAEPTDYVIFAGTERYRELESTCDAYPGRCVRVGNTTIIQ